MSKELVIGSNRHETKVAILEEDQLVEVYFQRANEYSLAGSIHKGRVTRVLPGMQSAFVDLGLERDTFLYVSDFFEEHEDIDTVDEKPSGGERRDRGSQRGSKRGDRTPREQFANRRSPERQEVEPAPPPEAAAEAAFPEPIAPEEEETADPGTEVIAGPSDEAKTSERTGEGEGFRGDRRNRRSRRRKQRGRGFPENKYAQPGEAGSAPPPQRTQSEPPPTSRVEAPESGPIPEVMVLPGESLAKYRHSSRAPLSSEEA